MKRMLLKNLITKYEFGMNDIEERVRTLMEDEARSCSMDFGCVTPEYVQRILGGLYSVEDIEAALESITKEFGLK